MRYLLLIYTEPSSEPVEPAAAAAMMQEYGAFSGWLRETGQYVGGEALEDTATATSVRVRDGRTLSTDGPFAETKEQLGGYYLIDARDLDAAIDAAARIPGARWGTVEIRPILEMPAAYATATASAGGAAG